MSAQSVRTFVESVPTGGRAVAEAAIPTSYVGTSIFGIPLPDWGHLLAIVFISLQIAFLVWRWRAALRREREGLPPLKDQG